MIPAPFTIGFQDSVSDLISDLLTAREHLMVGIFILSRNETMR